MKAKKITMIVVWHLWSGQPDNFYDRQALYDDWDELVAQMRQEVDAGRNCMVDTETITRAEWEALPEIDGMVEQTWTSTGE